MCTDIDMTNTVQPGRSTERGYNDYNDGDDGGVCDGAAALLLLLVLVLALVCGCGRHDGHGCCCFCCCCDRGPGYDPGRGYDHDCECDCGYCYRNGYVHGRDGFHTERGLPSGVLSGFGAFGVVLGLVAHAAFSNHMSIALAIGTGSFCIALFVYAVLLPDVSPPLSKREVPTKTGIAQAFVVCSLFKTFMAQTRYMSVYSRVPV